MKFARIDITTTVEHAAQWGRHAGAEAVIRYHHDPGCFEEAANPFGHDSEPDLWEAWQDAYEDTFELLK